MRISAGTNAIFHVTVDRSNVVITMRDYKEWNIDPGYISPLGIEMVERFRDELTAAIVKMKETT